MSRAPDLSPREAVERWLDKRRVDVAEQTASAYWYRLKLFVEWAESESYESMRSLEPWDVETYEAYRRAEGIAPVTLRAELRTLREFFRYCERVGIVESDLADAVDPPRVPTNDEVDDTRLAPSAAKALIQHYRGTDTPGNRYHVLLELLWYTGARMGGLQSLDLDDVDLSTGTLRFRHRPESGTTLKKQQSGERIVGLPEPTVAVVRSWLRHHRPDVFDGNGREPLLATSQGRAHHSTLRNWCYHATVPCRYTDCPHGKDPATCEWNQVQKASACPSSRSPHQVRTGSLTWQRSRGIPVEVVAKRANASPDVIRKHYDKPSEEESFRERRQPYLDDLNFGTEEE